MAKDPAFLFYPSDFLTGTIFFSLEDLGLFIRLLCIQHQHEGRIKNYDFNQICSEKHQRVREKFVEDDNGFYNKRLELEIAKRKRDADASRNNGLKGGRPITKEKPKNNLNKTNRLKNNNLTINENINEDEIENEVEFEKSIEQRKIDFFNSVGLQFSSEYSKSTLSEFCEYWTEHNPNGKRMRFEMQKVFDTNRRLKTWSKNNFSNNGKPKSKFDGYEQSVARAVELAKQFVGK